MTKKAKGSVFSIFQFLWLHFWAYCPKIPSLHCELCCFKIVVLWDRVVQIGNDSGPCLPRCIRTAVSLSVQRSGQKQQDSDPAAVAQPVERVLGKDEVMGSNPISSSVQAGQARIA
jgi:hypothetical protein